MNNWLRRRTPAGILTRILLLIVPVFLLWQWMLPYVMELMINTSDIFWPGLFTHGVVRVGGKAMGDWVLHTGWAREGAPADLVTLRLSGQALRRMVVGLPLLITLLAATSPGHWRRGVLGIVLLLAISWLSITGWAWHQLAVMTGTTPSFVDDTAMPPPFRLAIEAYPAWQYYLSGYLAYLGVLVIPFIGPIVVWAALCRRQLARLVIRLQHHRRFQAS
ncbi:exosortase H-associated membrane protein [Paucibacter sp. DJ2R-2]|uniref:exosortase H-associated membrane protein n=1 Tax=Paucibacter sp. DJ2R-2 TaxID=2893558 RepID=UPI0021E50D42|nr:exosortase H-associated membrane protein [Paucibacter sp. DJ2R-2]MCV2419223.1 hypothetical protein [Paucibacter sp. DJ4R-1]MCV2437822.1 hypothetical protein [Paucibacter sp. DJ2R-2]